MGPKLSPKKFWAAIRNFIRRPDTHNLQDTSTINIPIPSTPRTPQDIAVAALPPHELILLSFGHQFGAPRRLDLQRGESPFTASTGSGSGSGSGSSTAQLPGVHIMYDVRSMANVPRRIKQTYNGTSKTLQQILFADPKAREIYSATLQSITEYIVLTVNSEQYKDDQRLLIFVGVGCELGRHRGVAVVDRLAVDLQDAFSTSTPRWNVQVVHRDLWRGSTNDGTRKRRKGAG
ncbi:hypothetical protein SISSUDRAFT_35113 [Sistotremastrum suecicum HHB10207 ss-3]|uniref:RapZ C-terminal domain-containing protein n=1 Tax=Sistotremastrum suecicum HHB10207 ss-3 TaxID=1314776 RepID=A0A166JDH4_9AGAM|nr:hypothetical protein SISSUDRAFT_35113 [Sistotremastrum suecicum HHB10207 ss-3]